MVELILTIVIMALLGSFGVPVIVLTLARFGYFEPINFVLIGRSWRFTPKVHQTTASTQASVTTLPRQAVFANVVTAVITVAAPNISVGYLATGSIATGLLKNISST